VVDHNAIALAIVLCFCALWFGLGALTAGSHHGPDRGVYMPGPDLGAWSER